MALGPDLWFGIFTPQKLSVWPVISFRIFPLSIYRGGGADLKWNGPERCKASPVVV